MTNEKLAHGDRRRLSRRTILQGASAGLAASLAAPLLSAWGQDGVSAQTATSPLLPITPASLPSAWTVEEIHRRWQGVRKLMKEEQLDCLLVPQHHPGAMIKERQDGDADVEYLTGNNLPFKWVVFPYEGTVTAVTTGQVRGAPEQKRSAQYGIELVFEKDGLWSASLIDSLRAKGMSRARIGVTNLVNSARQPEGEVDYTTYTRVLRAFPQAKFIPASDLLGKVQILHSPEEIAVLEHSTRVGELGLKAMFETARPRVPQRVVWLAMFDAMLNASGERPWRISIQPNGSGNQALNRPLEEMLRAGQVLSQECAGSVLGYGSQVNHSIVIGSPAPADWESAAKDSLDTFHEMLDAIAPGKAVKEVCASYDRRLVARGEKPGALVIHSGGLGTLPRGGSAGPVGKIVLQPTMVFDVKPSFRLRNGGTAQFGDSVVVTEKGARRLGLREMKVVTLGA